MTTCIQDIDIYAETGLIHGGSLLLEGEKIARISKVRMQDSGLAVDEWIDGHGLAAVPGYIDTHVHGGGGFDINDGTADSILGTRDFYRRHGVTAFCPTYMALPLATIENGLKALRKILPGNIPGKTEILGAHLEGPFLNPAFNGSQAKDLIIPIDDDNVRIYETYRDVIARTTVAPEYGHNLDYFPGIVSLGIQLSMGHSQAVIRQAEEGMKRGATSVTHLYNAMSQTHKEGPHRIGGLVEAGLTLDGLYAEAICDGFHLPDELLRIAFRCKGPDRMLIVSDACLCAGMPSGTVVRTGGVTFHVEDGISMNETRTSFASSTTPLDGMVRHLIFHTGLPAEDVIRMAAATPARLLGLGDRKGTIAEGKDADIILVDAGFNIVKTFCKGIDARSGRA